MHIFISHAGGLYKFCYTTGSCLLPPHAQRSATALGLLVVRSSNALPQIPGKTIIRIHKSLGHSRLPSQQPASAGARLPDKDITASALRTSLTAPSEICGSMLWHSVTTCRALDMIHDIVSGFTSI